MIQINSTIGNYSFAFTLIEFFIIIAILATILFPVFAGARENARRTSYWVDWKKRAAILPDLKPK